MLFQEELGVNGIEIMNGLKYVRFGNGFVLVFLFLDKMEVNGFYEYKLFIYLKVRIIYVDVLC